MFFFVLFFVFFISRSGKVWKMDTIVWKNIYVSKTLNTALFFKIENYDYLKEIDLSGFLPRSLEIRSGKSKTF